MDVYAVIKLQRTTSAFRRWVLDPASERLMQESAQPDAFEHNTVLLEVAAMFENARLGLNSCRRPRDARRIWPCAYLLVVQFRSI